MRLRAMVLAGLGLVTGWMTAELQDPQKAPGRPTPPDDAAPLDPVPEPYLAPVDRRDLIQQFAPKHGLEGMYRLSALVRAGGRQVLGAEGYLVLGRQHLSLHLQAPGLEPGKPHFRSGFRRYRIRDDRLEMIALVGQANDLDGEIVLDGRGAEFSRSISVVGSSLRVLDADGGYMEFVRIE